MLRLGISETTTRYDQIINTCQCGENFDEPSATMGVLCTLEMLLRSQKEYGVRYTKYVGDGDSKTLNNFPDLCLHQRLRNSTRLRIVVGKSYRIIKQ